MYTLFSADDFPLQIVHSLSMRLESCAVEILGAFDLSVFKPQDRRFENVPINFGDGVEPIFVSRCLWCAVFNNLANGCHPSGDCKGSGDFVDGTSTFTEDIVSSVSSCREGQFHRLRHAGGRAVDSWQ